MNLQVMGPKLAGLALILFSVTLSAAAQIMLKKGMSGASGDFVAVALHCIRSPWIIAGFAAYGLGALVWLAVLARYDASYAYPFVGIGFLITLAFAAVFLGEHVSAWRLGGVCLIIGGITMVATL